MEFNKGDEEDSENEERAMITSRPIDCVAFARRVIKVGDKKVPVTIQLLGCDSKFFIGIRVTLYDPTSIGEYGFFLTVRQSLWEKSEEDKKSVKVKNYAKGDLLMDHFTLGQYLKRKGADIIFKTMRVLLRSEMRRVSPLLSNDFVLASRRALCPSNRNNV